MCYTDEFQHRQFGWPPVEHFENNPRPSRNPRHGAAELHMSEAKVKRPLRVERKVAPRR